MKKVYTIFILLSLIGLSGIFAQEKIFYVAKSVSNYNTVFSINTDGSNKVQIFNDTYHRTGVCVSSDNELYYLKRQNDLYVLGGTISLCKSDINGQNETELWIYPNSTTLDLRGSIELRSDKQKILYATYELSNRDGNVFELDLTTFISTNISQNNDYPPSGYAKYSADLSKILFIELATNWYGHPWNMFLINSDGTNRVQQTPNGAGSYYTANFSHDGSKLVYMFNVNLGDPEQLYVSNSNGTNGQRVMLSSGASDDIWNPTYSPDDTKLVFYRSPNMVISNTDGTIISEFPIEPIGDQFNITWVNLTQGMSASITIPDTIQNISQQVEVPINTSVLNTSDNVISYQFNLAYDNTKLQYSNYSLTGTGAAFN